MNKLNLFLSLIILISISLTNCDNGDDPQSIKDERTGYLINKTGNWSLKSINVPVNSATTENEWTNFNLAVTTSTMTTSGHAPGAEAVWPTGDWTMNEGGTFITREDGVVMSIITLTQTYFSVTFTVPDGVELSGRMAALDGEYLFELE